MTRPRRIAHSMLSVAFALTTCAFGVSLTGHEHTLRSIVSGAMFVVFYGTPFCTFGWLLALPLILHFDPLTGRRLRAMLIAGALLGPVTLYIAAALIAFASGGPTWTDRVWSAISYVRHFPTQDRALPNMLLLATAISVLTTTIYVLSVSYADRLIADTNTGNQL